MAVNYPGDMSAGPEPQRVAVVTGGGQGVGRGVALALAAAGYRVAVLGRRVNACAAVADEIAARDGLGLALRCDVTSRAEIDACVAEIVEAWGRIDALVNNAQSMVYESVRKLTEQDMALMWESGPMGSMRFMQASFAHLRQSAGCVVNMASGSGVVPQPRMAGYAMVKEAMRALTRATALEWGRFGIRVNAVCPLAGSPGFDQFAEVVPGDVLEMVAAQIPLGRIGDAEADIGRAVAHLCSPEMSYVTGTTLMIDGGYTHLG